MAERQGPGSGLQEVCLMILTTSFIGQLLLGAGVKRKEGGGVRVDKGDSGGWEVSLSGGFQPGENQKGVNIQEAWRKSTEH